MSDPNSSITVQPSEALNVFSGITSFDAAQRMAKALSSSTLVPEVYQGQSGLANSLIALEIAGRMQMSPLLVMQNLHIVKGRPSWSSQFLIATVNASGRFSPLRFTFDDQDAPTWCYAEAKDLSSGEVLRGERITLEMARSEGWSTKAGSKWQTMPGQMFRYRAAAFWVRAYCPEISLGIATTLEMIDAEPVKVSVVEPVNVVEQPPQAAITPEPEPEVVIEAPSETLAAALAAIAAAPDDAPTHKFMERANQLLVEKKINDTEHATISQAIQERIEAKADGAAPAVGPAADAAPDGVHEAAAAPAGTDPPADGLSEPAEPGPTSGRAAVEVELKLRDRQQLIRSVNALAPERKAALMASLGERFNIDSPAQLKSQAHSDHVIQFLKVE